ncbi:GGDEF domain-containing protein [Cetobacterium somerae]|uniref:GGDEF domain-containing protein n=1 Tax=Cetobacterium sp. NK01 TaxID=2993530 RepID=UPI0021166F93|nr:GGDEF domain-containing protein [Cetobacterium sp. NK01]MCQ8213532.1 GGDEF domain-containing protein [Cetobacterium sp. NK01]
MLEELQSIFNTLSTGVVVLNNKAEVKFLNQYMTSVIKKKKLNTLHLGELFGNLFTCIHTEENSQKCGETKNCPECPLRNSLENVSKALQIVVFEKEFYLTEEKQKLKKFFGISMKPILNSLEGEVLIEVFPIKHDKVKEFYIYYQSIEEVNKKVYKDLLTGLYNRNFYEEKISKIYSNFNTLSVILFDIDNFKSLNDTQGHIEGDRILKELSEIIRKNTNGESYGIRMGGDEFLILLKENKENALNIAKSILEDFKKLNKSISAGLVEKNVNLMDIKELYKKADMALYTAKKNGKGTIVVSY